MHQNEKEKVKLILMKQAKNQKNEEENQKNFQQIEQLKEKEEKKKKKIKKTRKKTIKGLVDFNNFIRDEVVEPGQKRSFNLAARNLKQENINSYC